MTESLLVYFQSRRVGVLRRDTLGQLYFAYDPDWLAASDAFAVSQSLPLASIEYREPAHSFFSNLLPEGAVRRAVTGRLGISETNDFELLRAIGGECAGALTIIPREHEPPPTEHTYARIDEVELARLNATSSVLSSYVGTGKARLSLAGAQDKLPVHLEGGQLHLPLGNSPSSHILKLANRDFAHLPANEVFVTKLAHRLQIPAVNVELMALEDSWVCLVERYDRLRDRTGHLTRLHQEDMCQAFAFGSHTKYEEEGGPSFARCLQLIRDVSVEPLVDTDMLLRWQIFNLLTGNSDGHAKNLSLLYLPFGPRLAPFYDLVCTRAYGSLSRHLAMSIGGQRDPGQIGAKHFLTLAKATGIGERYVRELVHDTLGMLTDALGDVATELCNRHGDLPAIEMVSNTIRRQLRRTGQLLGP